MQASRTLTLLLVVALNALSGVGAELAHVCGGSGEAQLRSACCCRKPRAFTHDTLRRRCCEDTDGAQATAAAVPPAAEERRHAPPAPHGPALPAGASRPAVAAHAADAAAPWRRERGRAHATGPPLYLQLRTLLV